MSDGTGTRSREPLPIRLAESGAVPEPMLRWGIRRLVAGRLRSVRSGWNEDSPARLVERLEAQPISPAPEAANRQHYTRPPSFFRQVLGPRVKYSGSYWPEGTETLADAERATLDLTCRRAGVEDGHRVLDLGCGWGALTLWVASRYPRAAVTAVTNSPDQAGFVREAARRRSLEERVSVVQTDVAEYRPDAGSFDRVLSVEMFEHLRNHGRLMGRIARWLAPGGRLFVHVFSHRRYAYEFTGEGAGAWMGRHFFTGGLMASHDLLPSLASDVEIEHDWWMSGLHYARTAEAWKRNLDRSADAAARCFEEAGDPDPELQVRRWRLFFLAVAEMFAFGEGEEWGISHYRFRPDDPGRRGTGPPSPESETTNRRTVEEP